MTPMFVTGSSNTVGERVGGEQAQLDLDGSDGVHGVAAADRGRAHLTQADAANFALGGQLGERLHGRLNGYFGSTRAHSKMSICFVP